jgi:hypothetical protein
VIKLLAVLVGLGLKVFFFMFFALVGLLGALGAAFVVTVVHALHAALFSFGSIAVIVMTALWQAMWPILLSVFLGMNALAVIGFVTTR